MLLFAVDLLLPRTQLSIPPQAIFDTGFAIESTDVQLRQVPDCRMIKVWESPPARIPLIPRDLWSRSHCALRSFSSTVLPYCEVSESFRRSKTADGSAGYLAANSRSGRKWFVTNEGGKSNGRHTTKYTERFRTSAVHVRMLVCDYR